MNIQRSATTSLAGWALLSVSVTFIAAAAFLVRGAPTGVPGLEVATAGDVVDAFLDLAFALVGALILRRQPGNLFGWAFLLVALCFEATRAADRGRNRTPPPRQGLRSADTARGA